MPGGVTGDRPRPRRSSATAWKPAPASRSPRKSQARLLAVSPCRHRTSGPPAVADRLQAAGGQVERDLLHAPTVPVASSGDAEPDRRRRLLPARVARPAAAGRRATSSPGSGTQAALVALPFQLYTETRLGLPDRPARRGRARPARRRSRCSAARSPTATTAARSCCSTRSRSSPCAAALAALRVLAGRAAGAAAVRARRAAGRLRRGPERHALGDRPEPRPAGEAALRARAQLRALPADARGRPGPRRPADRVATSVGAAYALDAVSCLAMVARWSGWRRSRRRRVDADAETSAARSPTACASSAATRRSRARSRSTCWR